MMNCALNSIIVILVGAAIAWLAAAFCFVQCKWNFPIVPGVTFYLITCCGFRNRPNLRAHCGWTILLGILMGSIFCPTIITTRRVTIEDQLLGFYGQFGPTNAALICASLLIAMFSVGECMMPDAEQFGAPPTPTQESTHSR